MIETAHDDTAFADRMPVFAGGDFMRAMHDEFGWMYDGAYAMPFFVKSRLGFRRLGFNYQPVALREGLEPEDEQRFLDDAVAAARSLRADCIVQQPMHALFAQTPQGAVRAPCLTYRLDLAPSPDDLLAAMHRNHRNAVKKAEREGLTVGTDDRAFEDAVRLHLETLERNDVATDYDREDLLHLRETLGERLAAHVSYQDDRAQGGVLSVWNRHGAFALTAGSAEGRHRGAMNQTYWHAFLDLKQRGAPFYDFTGGMVDPPRESKHHGIQMFKERFGAQVCHGYLWKMDLRPLRVRCYRALAAVRAKLAGRPPDGPDVIDREGRRHGTI